MKKKRQVFIVWFFIFLVWAVYRAYFRFFPEWVDELIFKPIIFVGPVLYIVLIKEKKSLDEIGLGSKKMDIWLDFYFGVLMGVMFALEGLFANYIKYGKLSFTALEAFKLSGGILPFFGLSLATAISEEILGRGFLYKRLNDISGQHFYSSVASSFLFLLIHIPIMFTRLNLHGTAFLIYPFTIMLLGITNCYVFSIRKSLSLPILIHTFWNMTVALYL